MIPGCPEAGCDEAGRGCLAGPVVAAAVILPADRPVLEELKAVTDSKKLSHKQREQLRPLILGKALAWGIAEVSPEEIDGINILNASILAMHRALMELKMQPEHILVDGNRFKPYSGKGKTPLPHTCVVKGDAKFLSIAAASILAKTHRDGLMEKLHGEFPVYRWNINKGYPTEAHRDAIRAHGPSPYHRKSFQLLPSQLRLPI